MSADPIVEHKESEFCHICGGAADKTLTCEYDPHFALCTCKRCRWRIYKAYGEGIPQNWAEYEIRVALPDT